MEIRVKGFHHRWAGAFHLGPFVDWHDIDQVDVGLNLGPRILGIRFLFGNRIIDPTEVDRQPRWDIGTRLTNDFGNWRYCRAGEDLRHAEIVEPSLAAKVMANDGLPAETPLNELIYGDVKGVTDPDRMNAAALGWPEVSVRRGRYCWIREVPPGAQFDTKAKP
jgi:hypothetical protein